MDFASLAEQAEALEAGAVSARELVDAALARADASAGLGIFVSRRDDAARAEAEAADARRRGGDARSPLDGVPVAIKDNLIHRGEPCECASQILEGFVAPYQGTAVARLCDAGAVVIGRTNMDEFAMGSSTEHSAHGPPDRGDRVDAEPALEGSTADTVRSKDCRCSHLVLSVVVLAGLEDDVRVTLDLEPEPDPRILPGRVEDGFAGIAPDRVEAGNLQPSAESLVEAVQIDPDLRVLLREVADLTRQDEESVVIGLRFGRQDAAREYP